MEDNTVLLEIKGLTKRYGSHVALDHLSVTLQPGIYGLLGANGAGKSTMMNLITDNVSRDGGAITYNGREILEMGDEFRAILGYMPQQQGIYEAMTAESFIAYIARLKGMRGKHLRSQVGEVLRLTNLTEVRHKAVGSFSGGMKQRVLLAQALLGDPRVLLLDEPTAGLDPRERLRIRNYIKDLAQNRIVLLATHIVSDIESIADRVMLLKGGKLLRMDTPQALIASLPDTWKPEGSTPGLEDVYFCFLGE